MNEQIKYVSLFNFSELLFFRAWSEHQNESAKMLKNKSMKMSRVLYLIHKGDLGFFFGALTFAHFLPFR